MFFSSAGDSAGGLEGAEVAPMTVAVGGRVLAFVLIAAQLHIGSTNVQGKDERGGWFQIGIDVLPVPNTKSDQQSASLASASWVVGAPAYRSVVTARVTLKVIGRQQCNLA